MPAELTSLGVAGGADGFLLLETVPLSTLEGWVTTSTEPGVTGYLISVPGTDVVQVLMNPDAEASAVAAKEGSLAEVSCVGAAILTNDQGDMITVIDPSEGGEHRIRLRLLESPIRLVVEAWSAPVSRP